MLILTASERRFFSELEYLR